MGNPEDNEDDIAMEDVIPAEKLIQPNNLVGDEEIKEALDDNQIMAIEKSPSRLLGKIICLI